MDLKNFSEIELLRSQLKQAQQIIEEQAIRIENYQISETALADANVHVAELYTELEEAYEQLREAKELEIMNIQLQEANHKLDKYTNNFKKSLQYARRIQDALLPSYVRIRKIFPDFFILFQPKDIVSGDFYWVGEIDSKKIVIVADCTGHGVPGALMSMIGHSLLTDIIIRRQISHPDQILCQLNNDLQAILKQDETENADGMDVGIWVWDTIQNRLHYGAAMNPTIYFQDETLHEIKGTKCSIGGRSLNQDFFTTSINVETETQIYLFSDGYQDQFGGYDSRKFLLKNFKTLLYAIHRFDSKQQKLYLEQILQRWMEHSQQIDDILIIGIKIKPTILP